MFLQEFLVRNARHRNLNQSDLRTDQNASSSMTVFPMQVAPPSTAAVTAGDVRIATSCVLAQSGLPNPVTKPSISNLLNRPKKQYS